MNNEDIEEGFFVNNYYDSIRHIYLKDKNDKVYFCKNDLCPITKVCNPIWLINELFCYYQAKKVNLNVPEIKFLHYQNIFYLGFEYLKTRIDIPRSRKKLNKLIENKDNKIQLIKCVLFDMLVLNSDRKLWNVLSDSFENDKLFFIDFDKAIFGNGNKDLLRFTASFEDKKRDYLTDYLACNEINELIFKEENIELIYEQLIYLISNFNEEDIFCSYKWDLNNSLIDTFIRKYLYSVLNDEKINLIKERMFLWKQFLLDFFSNRENIDVLRKLLDNKEKKK